MVALNTRPPSRDGTGLKQASKPGPKGGRAYGLGIAARGGNRRQLTVTFPVEVLEKLNAVAERTHTPRSVLILMAVQRLLEGQGS